MMTFTSEFVRKSLTGVRPDDPEAIPHTFVAIATSDVSQPGTPYVFFFKKSVVESPDTPLVRGSPIGQTGPSRLLEVALGP